MSVTERTFGININDHGDANIMVWGPLLESLELVGEGKNIRIPLQKNEYGFWSATTHQLNPGDQYFFLLNGEKKRPDPASLFQPKGVHGPSEVVALQQFSWSDFDWGNLALEDYILYELHAGTFSENGNFEGIEKKLDYLKSLGITAIEIMPVAQFPGDRNWGYDGVFPFAVQNSYGGPKGLQQLVDACHQRGLAVVLDVVHNHVGPEGNYLGEFGPFFTDKYHTPWGNAINFDDAWCDGVRQFFIENVLMWFRDFHIDALRMDAVHAIKDFSPKHILQEIRERVDELKFETGREHHLIVELDLNDPKFIHPLREHGYGMDAQWIDEFHHALRVTSGQPRNGYYADFDGIGHLAKSYRDAYVFDGIYSTHRHRTFGSKADKNPGKQFIVFSQNHDHVGNRMLGERTSQLVSFEMLKLMAGAVLVSPFLPMLFMGEEFAESNPFLYFVSHSDKDLIEAVRKGRKAEFAYFHAEGEAPDPQAEDSFHQSKLNWALLNKEPNKNLLAYYQSLIALRQKNNVLRQPDRKNLNVSTNTDQQTLVLHRWKAEEHLWCFMNFSATLQMIQIPHTAGELKKTFDSADPAWMGPEAGSETVSGTQALPIQPESILVYTN